MIEHRSVEIRNITMPVRVSHGNLAPDQRIDDLTDRIDTLLVGLRVRHESKGSMNEFSMDGAWNYGDVYQRLCLADVQTITGPLEGILDETTSMAEKTAVAQGITVHEIEAWVDRMGLAVGYPRLSVRKTFTPEPIYNAPQKRSAGICSYPLVISVNHAWCRGSQRVEHVDVRTESVDLSFRAETRASTLSASNLTGLYNYAGLIHQVEKMQGIEIKGPVEMLCDKVSSLLEDDARSLGVDLLKTVVQVKRTGYARCTPILTLTRYFER